jgi:hypothetical protein
MPNYKIIGADGKEYGPVTSEQLRQWITEGRVNAQTKSQPEGAADWQLLGDLAEFADVLRPAASAVPVPPPVAATASVAWDGTIDIGDALSRGWQLLTTNFWLLVGGSVITFLLLGVGGAMPFIGGIIGIVVDGPLMGGLYLLFLKRQRNQPAEVGTVFDGFRTAFGQLILAHLIPGLLIGLCIVPGAIVLGISFAMMHSIGKAAMAGVVIGGLLLLVGLPVAIYLGVGWVFTVPLVADKRLGFSEAMKLSRSIVNKRWWSFFGLFFVCGLLAVVGLLGCVVGVFVTSALALAAVVTVYEDIFGVRTS